MGNPEVRHLLCVQPQLCGRLNQRRFAELQAPILRVGEGKCTLGLVNISISPTMTGQKVIRNKD